MKIKSRISTAVAIIATLGLTSQAWGACNTDSLQTGATNVFELSGQGNFKCADLNMVPVQSFTEMPSSSGNGIDWTSTEEADGVVVEPSQGNRCVYIYPDQATSGDFLTPGNNKSVSDVLVCTDGNPGIVVAVATVSADTGSVTEDDADPLMTSGNVTITDPDPTEAFAQPDTFFGIYGSTFIVDVNGNWTYEADNTLEVIQLLDAGQTLNEQFTITSQDLSASNLVMITINGIDEEEEVLPTTTAGDNCEGSIDVSGVEVLPDGSVVIAESLDGQTKAACSVTAGSGQAYCEDRCENFRDVGETAACTQSVNINGEYDLAACQPCDTVLDVIANSGTPPLHPVDGTPMEFCWEKVNSAFELTGDLAGTPPDITNENGADVLRTPGTMLKHTPIRQSEISITWFNACYKVPVSINGRTYWVTTCR